MKTQIRVRPFSENSLLVEWPPAADAAILQQILALKSEIENLPGHQIIEIVPAFHSMAVFFDPNLTTQNDLAEQVLFLHKSLKTEETPPGRRLELPVCYHPDLAPDLENFAAAKKMSIEKVIELHTSVEYLVHFIGFLPGFPYLSGLDERLFFPRKSQPKMKVAPGSVGIGGQQTGIYPIESPGGWHIVGHCPMPLFDVLADPPALLQPGDRVRFYRIGLDGTGKFGK